MDALLQGDTEQPAESSSRLMVAAISRLLAGSERPVEQHLSQRGAAFSRLLEAVRGLQSSASFRLMLRNLKVQAVTGLQSSICLSWVLQSQGC